MKDANISEAVRIAQITAESNESIAAMVLIGLFLVVSIWSMS